MQVCKWQRNNPHAYTKLQNYFLKIYILCRIFAYKRAKNSLCWHIVPFAQSKSINLSDKTTRSINRNGIVAQKQNSYLFIYVVECKFLKLECEVQTKTYNIVCTRVEVGDTISISNSTILVEGVHITEVNVHETAGIDAKTGTD